MASLTENRPLLYSLLASGSVLAVLASGLFPEVSEWFEVALFPDDVCALGKFIASLVCLKKNYFYFCPFYFEFLMVLEFLVAFLCWMFQSLQLSSFVIFVL